MVLKQRGNKNGIDRKEVFFLRAVMRKETTIKIFCIEFSIWRKKMNQGKIFFLAELTERIAMTMVYCINTWYFLYIGTEDIFSNKKYMYFLEGSWHIMELPERSMKLVSISFSIWFNIFCQRTNRNGLYNNLRENKKRLGN